MLEWEQFSVMQERSHKVFTVSPSMLFLEYEP